MAKAGDKFIVEIESVFVKNHDDPAKLENRLYKAKGFNSLVFDENGLWKLTPYEDKGETSFDEGYKDGEDNGISATWDTAKQILELSPADREYLFGYEDPKFIFRMFEPVEAMEIILNHQSTDTDELNAFRKAIHDCLEIDLTVEQVDELINILNAHGRNVS